MLPHRACVGLFPRQGKFGFLFLHHLYQLYRQWRTSSGAAATAHVGSGVADHDGWPRVKYIMTDYAVSNISVLRRHPCLLPLVDLGVLDFAVFDANSGDAVSACMRMCVRVCICVHLRASVCVCVRVHVCALYASACACFNI